MDRNDVGSPADHDTGARTFHAKTVLVLDMYFAALLLEFVGELVQQPGVFHLPARGIEVAGRLRVILVIRLEPVGPQAALVADECPGQPAHMQIWVGSSGSHVPYPLLPQD